MKRVNLVNLCEPFQAVPILHDKKKSFHTGHDQKGSPRFTRFTLKAKE